jgi:uncharacterized protein
MSEYLKGRDLMSDQLDVPLNQGELGLLEEFLESDACEDETMTLSQAQGFLTAVVSGPDMIMPSEWMPQIWGHPDFETEAQAQEVTGLLMRVYNEVASGLKERRDFGLLLEEWGSVDEEKSVVALPWCEGYLAGMALRPTAWAEHSDGDLGSLLLPIILIARPETDREQALVDDPDEYDRLCDLLPDSAQAIYDYWLSRRTGDDPSNDDWPPQQQGVTPEPCPCGSGRSYWQCCGAPGAVH